MKQIILILQTIRYLKIRQILSRITLKIKNSIFEPVIRARVMGAPGHKTDSDVPIGLQPKALIELHCDLKAHSFSFLNHTVRYDGPILWNDPQQEKLWLYNLHYFDFLLPLTAKADAGQFEQAKKIITDWIENNPIGQGNGWEPYPISLRAVNWIFFYDACFDFFERDAEFRSVFLTSLYRQLHYLTFFLEYHLLANHLWANAKALVFGGLFFNIERWTKKGRRLLERELKEQILPDGGHYERSPMYHSIILTDVLDLINLFQHHRDSTGIDAQKRLPSLNAIAAKMLNWLRLMTHPDGQISLFGDSALGIAAPPERIEQYARRVGVAVAGAGGELAAGTVGSQQSVHGNLVAAAQSGYFVFRSKDFYFAMDAGELGVPYQPGHAHCDLFSFECSFKGVRFIVDSGVGNYLPTGLRHQARGIYGHNTVVVNGLDQAELWSAFRMGRRVAAPRLRFDAGAGLLTAEYDNRLQKARGYSHKREVQWTDGSHSSIRISDTVRGKNIRSIESLIHSHPDCKITIQPQRILLENAGVALQILLNEGIQEPELRDWFYVPEFGTVLPARVIVLRPQQGRHSLSYDLTG